MGHVVFGTTVIQTPKMKETSPEKGPFQKESQLPSIIFQGRAVGFGKILSP